MCEELSILITYCVITVMYEKSYQFWLHLVSSLSCIGRVINSGYILCQHCHVWEELSILVISLQCQIIHVPEVYCKTFILTFLWSVLRCDKNQVQYLCKLLVCGAAPYKICAPGSDRTVYLEAQPLAATVYIVLLTSHSKRPHPSQEANVSVSYRDRIPVILSKLVAFHFHWDDNLLWATGYLLSATGMRSGGGMFSSSASTCGCQCRSAHWL